VESVKILWFGFLPSGTEWFVIGLLALLLFGPKKLPELARSLGKTLGEFRRAKAEFEQELSDAITVEEQKTATRQALPPVSGTVPVAPPEQSSPPA
jgi:TatA/E family protein of Tat protein translocase